MRVLAAATVVSLVAMPVFAEPESFDFSGFDEISASEGVTVNVTTGSDFAVSAEAHRGNLRRLKMKVRGGALEIERRQGFSLLSPGRRDEFEVWVTMPELSDVHAYSGSRVLVKGQDINGLTARSSSGSTLKIDGISGGDVRLKSSSGSSLRADGVCGDLTADSSSGASLVVDGLKCETADLEASSGASLRAHVTKTAQAAASSGASIRIKGGAAFTEATTSSGGSVSR